MQLATLPLQVPSLIPALSAFQRVHTSPLLDELVLDVLDELVLDVDEVVPVLDVDEVVLVLEVLEVPPVPDVPVVPLVVPLVLPLVVPLVVPAAPAPSSPPGESPIVATHATDGPHANSTAPQRQPMTARLREVTGSRRLIRCG